MTEAVRQVSNTVYAPPLPQSIREPDGDPVPVWSSPQRVLFRFVCSYWLLLALPPSTALLIGFQRTALGRSLNEPLREAWHATTTWVATHVFRLDAASARFLPGAETAHTVVGSVLFLSLALLAAIVWSRLDRRRENYHALNGWLRLVVRYMLAISLFEYGFDKVIPLQFQWGFGLTRLMEPFGEFSRSGVLWNFMAVSIPYTVTTGVVEVLAASLLLFKRTTYLGAALAFVAMLNVLLLNLFYNVGVVILSTNLLLMAVFLMAPAVGPLIAVLVRRRAVDPPTTLDGPRINTRGWRVATNALCVILVVQHLSQQLVTGFRTGRGNHNPSKWDQYKSLHVNPARSPLYGLYRVERGGPAGWAKVAIEYPTAIAVRTHDDSVKWFPVEYDTAQRRLILDRKAALGSFVWTRPDSTHLMLDGAFGDSSVSILLRRIDTGLRLPNSRFRLFGDGADFNR